MKLKDQVVLITGGGVGLGAAMARAFAAEGARLALCGRRMEPLEALAKDLGPEHLALHCDVTDETQIAETFSRCVSKFGRLDILVNNAGIGDWITFEETTTEYFDAVLATNLRGPFLCTRYAWPHLKASKGQVLNISSIAGTNAYKEMTAYCSSKWGLNGLTETLILEGESLGIRVMSLGPGSVDTDIWGDHATAANRERMMKSEQVAELALWMLASPRNVLVKKTVIENFTDPFAE